MPKAAIINAPVYHNPEGAAPIMAPIVNPHGRKPSNRP